MKQLSGQDAAFLYGETPNWHMHVSGLMVVDAESAPEEWTFDRFRELLISRVPEIPQLRWKLVDVPFGLDRPSWVEEPDIDFDYHIRRIALPRPGGPTSRLCSNFLPSICAASSATATWAMTPC